MESKPTRASLLSRVRNADDSDAWREFDATYRDLILRYCRARRLQAADADDVRQAVMFSLSKALRTFEYRPDRGRFRHYLCRTVRNAILQQMARPNTSAEQIDTTELAMRPAEEDGEADAIWEREWMDHHYRLAMKTIRATFDPRSVAVFDQLLGGQAVETVAEANEMSTQAVHKVKQRIRNRMKELLQEQIRYEDEPV